MEVSVGTVESVKNEVCIVKGLRGVGLSNVVTFSSGGQGIVLGFDEEKAQVVMFRDFLRVKRGDLVRKTADFPTISVSEALLGRVIDPLGEPIDGGGVVDGTGSDDRRLERPARPVFQRRIVNEPLHTGYMIIDSQIPIGLGQRELLLGERRSGQNEIAVDIICNQTLLNTGVKSIYVAVDAETALVKRRVERMHACGALANTVVVLGRSARAASVNYIAPMVGLSIAEWFADHGEDTLVVIDDLSRHAKVYRQLSLLLDKPATREAYPGDIFYLHSRLLERCGAFNESAGGGTITALPIVETQTEDATDFITTNLMSITDGHVLFRQALANKGVRPAIDSGFSVSRIGGRAQVRLERELSEKMKNIIIRYAEIERFLAFGSEMNSSTKEVYELGRRLVLLMNQTQEDHYGHLDQVVMMYLVESKRISSWADEQIDALRDALITFIHQPPNDSLLNDTILQLGLEEAVPALDDCLDRFMHDTNTPHPVEDAPRLTAETETISQILNEQGERYGKN